jgi:hypothetical protein
LDEGEQSGSRIDVLGAGTYGGFVGVAEEKGGVGRDYADGDDFELRGGLGG